MNYKTLIATRNAGEYIGGGSPKPLAECKREVRKSAGCRVYWREDGGDLAAYRHTADMHDEDKAFARIVSA